MNTAINTPTFPHHMSGVSDGSKSGTHFYNDDNGDELLLAGVTVQQEGLAVVRVRFAAHYGIGSLVMGPDDTLTVNAVADVKGASSRLNPSPDVV